MQTTSTLLKSKNYYFKRGKPPKGFNLEQIVENKPQIDHSNSDFSISPPTNVLNFDNLSSQETIRKELLVAVIPAYTKEDRLNTALQSLVDQSIKLDWILVLLNGPDPKNGQMSVAETQAREFAAKYSNIEILKLDQAGKVNALNHSYNYINSKIWSFKAKGIDLSIPHALYIWTQTLDVSLTWLKAYWKKFKTIPKLEA